MQLVPQTHSPTCLQSLVTRRNKTGGLVLVAKPGLTRSARHITTRPSGLHISSGRQQLRLCLPMQGLITWHNKILGLGLAARPAPDPVYAAQRKKAAAEAAAKEAAEKAAADQVAATAEALSLLAGASSHMLCSTASKHGHPHASWPQQRLLQTRLLTRWHGQPRPCPCWQAQPRPMNYCMGVALQLCTGRLQDMQRRSTEAAAKRVQRWQLLTKWRPQQKPYPCSQVRPLITCLACKVPPPPTQSRLQLYESVLPSAST